VDDERSANDSAANIRYLLTHPEFAAQLGRNGREHVKENFLMTTNVRRWLLLLQILLRSGTA
jgi:trehalose synthase